MYKIKVTRPRKWGEKTVLTIAMLVFMFLFIWASIGDTQCQQELKDTKLQLEMREGKDRFIEQYFEERIKI